MTFGAIVNIDEISGTVAVTLMLALACALTSISIAAHARSPGPAFLPATPAWALQYVKELGDLSEAQFIREWFAADVLTALRVARKARLVRWSTRFGVASLAFMALSFVVAVATIPESGTEENLMSNESPSAELPPDPAATPITPSPSDSVDTSGPQMVDKAGPQAIQESMDPAGPPTYQFSHDGE